LTGKKQADYQTSDQARSSPWRSLSFKLVLKSVHQVCSRLLSSLSLEFGQIRKPLRREATGDLGEPRQLGHAREDGKSKVRRPCRSCCCSVGNFHCVGEKGRHGRISYYPFFLTSITILYLKNFLDSKRYANSTISTDYSFSKQHARNLTKIVAREHGAANADRGRIPGTGLRLQAGFSGLLLG
jgi:hypothetical protein